MKAGEKKWREERDAVFRYRKRMTVLERKHPEAAGSALLLMTSTTASLTSLMAVPAKGILGVDGPTHPDTILYKERYHHLAAQASLIHTPHIHTHRVQPMFLLTTG